MMSYRIIFILLFLSNVTSLSCMTGEQSGQAGSAAPAAAHESKALLFGKPKASVPLPIPIFKNIPMQCTCLKNFTEPGKIENKRDNVIPDVSNDRAYFSDPAYQLFAYHFIMELSKNSAQRRVILRNFVDKIRIRLAAIPTAASQGAPALINCSLWIEYFISAINC